MSVNETHRVVVRRRKGATHAHHGGSWKIAYADFMTAMMAFFLVMWLVSITSQKDREGIAEYFRQPLKVSVQGGDSAATRSSPIPGSGGDPTRVDGEVRRAEPSPRTQQMSEAERRDVRRLENLRHRLDSLIERSPVLRQFKPQLLIDMTSEGLRIQIVDDRNRPMFASGRAVVEPYMRSILREVGPLLNELPNKVSITGHTDATQYSTGERSYSNWELSADRANASRRELIAGGMQEDKVMRIMGLASSMNLVKNDPYAAVNRRISLVVLNMQTQRRIELENASAPDIRAEGARAVMGGVADQMRGEAAGTIPSAPVMPDAPDTP